MEATLIVVEGEAQAPFFHLNLPAIIGRSRNADLKLGHPLVSRQHCELFEADGTMMVRDLGSLNGTYVGETRIANEVSLEPGGLLTIGSVTFRAKYEQPERAAEPEAAAVAFAPLADEVEAGTGEETIQAGGLDDLEQMQTAEQSAEAPDGFGWLDDNAEAAPVAEAAEAPVEEDELSFEPVQIGEEAPAAEEAALDDFNLSFDQSDDTQAAPQAEMEAEAPAEAVEEPEMEFEVAEPEAAEPEAAELEPAESEPAEPEVAAPVAEEEEFNFAPPAEEEEHAEGQVDDGDLDDFFKNLK